jgi:hypothetical protein
MIQYNAVDIYLTPVNYGEHFTIDELNLRGFHEAFTENSWARFVVNYLILRRVTDEKPRS